MFVTGKDCAGHPHRLASLPDGNVVVAEAGKIITYSVPDSVGVTKVAKL